MDITNRSEDERDTKLSEAKLELTAKEFTSYTSSL